MSKNASKTILTIVVGFLVLYIFLEKSWMVYTALALGVLSLISPFISDWILKLWFGLAKVLGFINSRILLTLIYYLVLLPLSLLSRLSSNQTIVLKKGLPSYFVERNHRYTKKDFEKPW